MNDNNQQVTWGKVSTISVQEIPPQTTGKYLGLFQDASLRLENTPPTEALRYQIDDPKVLAGAYAALKKMFSGQGVEVMKRAGALFVYNTVSQAGKRIGRPPKSPSIADIGNGGSRNGRRLNLPDMAQVMDGEMGDEEEV